MQNPKIYGFAFIRNGIKYDYPYLISLSSLKNIAEKIYLALGKSEDGTESTLMGLDFLKIYPTVWDESLRSGGLILSQQTNFILNELRKDLLIYNKNLDGAWGFYLQGDEVISEEENALIINDIKFAEENGYDAVSFRFLHFWQNHHQIAINKKWYPHEIRAIKLKSKIESWGDAQSFRNYNKVFFSDAHIFHYGHVRSYDKYHIKKEDILKLYHDSSKIKKYKLREKKLDRQTKCIDYWGHHPLLMNERIEKFGESILTQKRNEVYIIGNENDYSKKIISKINAEKVVWVENRTKIPNFVNNDDICDLNPSLIDKIRSFFNVVPRKMESKLAKKWTNDFYLVVCLSAKKISIS